MKFGLIGHNIGYSKSQQIFESKGIEYEVYDVDHIEQGIELALNDNLSGFNVTTPFKSDILPYLDMLMPTAEITGSVNCVKVISDCYIGESFDGSAFGISLDHYLSNHDDWEFEFPHNIAILGNGGVVPSIHYELNETIKHLKDGHHEIAVFARNPRENENKLSDFDAKYFDLIVNTIPFKAGIDINFNNKDKFIYYDLNYADDTLIKKAEKNKNCSWAIDGLDMLERQADMAYGWWTT